MCSCNCEHLQVCGRAAACVPVLAEALQSHTGGDLAGAAFRWNSVLHGTAEPPPTCHCLPHDWGRCVLSSSLVIIQVLQLVVPWAGCLLNSYMSCQAAVASGYHVPQKMCHAHLTYWPAWYTDNFWAEAWVANAGPCLTPYQILSAC